METFYAWWNFNVTEKMASSENIMFYEIIQIEMLLI